MDIPGFVASFFESNRISIFEGVMLICFGMSWPVSVIKALRTKIVKGKSPLFMSLVAIGYIFGISHKLLYSRDYLVMLYMLNLTMILTDLYLYTRYNLRAERVHSKLAMMRRGATIKKGTAAHFGRNQIKKMIAVS